MMDCACFIKYGEFLDDSQIFESVESFVCDVELPDWYRNFVDVFSASGADILPEHRLHDCAIDFKSGDSVPPFSPIYNLAEQDLIDLKSYIESNMRKCFITKSNSPACAGVFFVPKKDGSKRRCVDYRGLNEMTCRNSLPMPLTSELLDRARRASKCIFHAMSIEFLGLPCLRKVFVWSRISCLQLKTGLRLAKWRSALDNWSHYLLGSKHKISIFSDHRNLVYYRSRRSMSPRLHLWSAFLNQFDTLTEIKASHGV